ncbi:pepsin/retropepsin-like aspartic protease family protein [Flaviaesturariibacter terrae]
MTRASSYDQLLQPGLFPVPGRLAASLPKRRAAVVVLALLLLLGAAASAAPALPPPADGRWLRGLHVPGSFFPEPDSVATVIPFNRVGNLILIQAQADSIEGNFIFDTGAQHVLLNSTYFRDYHAVTVSDAESAGINGGSGAPLQRITLGRLGLGSLRYNQQEADLGNLGHIENSKGVRILGLLGMELFQDCEIMLDYDENLLYIHRLRKRDAAMYTNASLTTGPADYTELPIELKENYILVRTEVAGKTLRFVMDSGAETSVLDSRLPNTVLEGVLVTRRVQVNGAGRKKEAIYGTLPELTVGPHLLRAVPVLISNLEQSCFSQFDCINGILSFDALSPRRIGFNFVTRKLYLWR